MAKLTILLASFLAILFLVDASIYRATVIFEDSSRGQSCRQEAERSDLSACERYIRQSRRSSDDVLALHGVENPQEQMSRCCSQLDQVREDCQCDALKYVVEQQMQQQRGREESQRMMRQRAREIPSTCGISQCEMRVALF